MELIAFVVMAAGAYIALITRSRAVVYAWFILFLVYSLIVRLSPTFTGDIAVYYQAAERWPPPIIFYTLREPVIWLGSSLLYEVLGNRVVTFLVIDVLIGTIVIRSMKALDDDGSDRMLALAPTIISSYVFLLGQQNVLRQHVAFAILLWALAARSRNQRRAIVLFLLSVLAHNSTAVLFGYWYDLGPQRRHRYGPLITVVGVILVAVLFPFLRKSTSATGLDTRFLYVAVAAMLGLLMLYANSGRLSGSRAAALMNFIAFTPAIGILGSAQFERVAMIFLVLMVTDLYRHHRSLRIGGAEVAHLAYAILVVPVFLFSNVRNLLLL